MWMFDGGALASFLSLVNKRDDAYGGDMMGRLRLPSEVVNAVSESVGDDYPVGVRINGEEFTKEGNTLLHSARIGRHLAGLGVDFISVSAGERFEDAEPMPEGFPPFPGTGYSGARMSPRWWSPDGTQVHLAEGIRQAVRDSGLEIPVITAGKIRTPELAEEILEYERADVIGMARALFSDPDWPVKAREGRADDIVTCAACGYCSESDERYEKVNSLVTNLKGVFTGGDMVNGPTSVIKAIGSGRRAAISIDRYLCGESLEQEEAEAATIGFEAVDIEMFKKRAQKEVPKKGCYDDEVAFIEAERCLQCGLFPKKEASGDDL